ncbi:MAG: hypothetical protein ACFB4I_23260 [Cyanophyceae cyanobacterium]
MAFVGTKIVIDSAELRSLINQLQSTNCYFFLRWPHKVSGFCTELPTDFPSPEGQVFNSQQELRWKQHGKGYSVLLLSASEEFPDFKLVGQSWNVREQGACVYPKTETRFPKRLEYQNINIRQRYFFDQQTATVYFVALVAR